MPRARGWGGGVAAAQLPRTKVDTKPRPVGVDRVRRRVCRPWLEAWARLGRGQLGSGPGETATHRPRFIGLAGRQLVGARSQKVHASAKLDNEDLLRIGVCLFVCLLLLVCFACVLARRLVRLP